MSKPDLPKARMVVEIDMMHVRPPQAAPDVILVSALTDGTKPSRVASLVKELRIPLICWRGMLRSQERMAKLEKITAARYGRPTPQDRLAACCRSILQAQ
ncbi:MAG: hypothetical protein ACK4RZ_09675 [Paracoccaceae bacterium]